MRRLAWLRLRGHDTRDINCIHWDQPRSDISAECRHCLANGGYVERVHGVAESDKKADDMADTERERRGATTRNMQFRPGAACRNRTDDLFITSD